MIYTCTNFKGFVLQYGTSAVVSASSPEKAAEILSVKLSQLGLPQSIHPSNMIPVHENAAEGGKVEILFDGDM